MNRLRPFEIRAIARDYILEHLHNNPESTIEGAEIALKERIKADLAGSIWLAVILAAVQVLLPILWRLFFEREAESAARRVV